MKHYSFTSIIIVISGLLTPVFSQSQPTGFSINPKAGIYTAKNEAGAVMGLETSYMQNGWMFTVDFFQFEEIKYFSSDEDIFRQVGIMTGKYYGDKLFRVQLQGGIAPIWQIGLREDSDPEKFVTVGLVFKTGFKFIPLPFFSIGLDLQGNLNPERPLLMPLISLEFGRLRDKVNKP